MDNGYATLLAFQKYMAVLLILMPISSRLEDFSALAVPLMFDIVSPGWQNLAKRRWFKLRQNVPLSAERSKYICYLVSVSVFLFLVPQIYQLPSEIIVFGQKSKFVVFLLQADDVLSHVTPAGAEMFLWCHVQFGADTCRLAAINANFQNLSILTGSAVNVLVAHQYSRAGYLDAFAAKQVVFQGTKETVQKNLRILIIKALKRFVLTVVALEICNYFLSFKFAYEVGSPPNLEPLVGSVSQTLMYLVTYFGILVSQWVLVGALAEATVIYESISGKINVVGRNDQLESRT
jgi:hypothetical protein